MPKETTNAAPNAPGVTFRQVLGNSGFLRLWIGQFVSSFGDWLAILALFSLIAFRWNGSPEMVAGIFIAFILPFTLLGPLAGVFVDRWHLKRTMIASDLLRAVLVTLFVFARTAWQVYAVMALVSVVSSFFLPAMNKAIPRLVKKEELMVANALNAQTIHFTKILAPALAGLLVAWAGEKACFYLDAVSFVFSAGMIAAIHLGKAAAEPPKTVEVVADDLPAAAATEPLPQKKGVRAVLHEFHEGFRFLHEHRVLRFVVLSMSAAMLVLGVFNAILAVYVRETLRGDSKIFGALMSAIGIGTITGAAWIGKFAQHRPKVLLIVWGIFGMGVGALLLALTTNAPVAVACSLALGFAASGVMIPCQTLTQQETPPAMLGRVSSTSISLMTFAQLAGVAASGKLTAMMGIRNLYLLAATLLGIIGAGGSLFATRLRLHGAESVNE